MGKSRRRESSKKRPPVRTKLSSLMKEQRKDSAAIGKLEERKGCLWREVEQHRRTGKPDEHPELRRRLDEISGIAARVQALSAASAQRAMLIEKMKRGS